MDKRFERLKWNSSLALVYQVILIVVGLVLPRCFLKYYGSEVNGLISSIAQFLSFINLCDMGISAVVSSALYEPLAHAEKEKISKIVVYARKFFMSIGIILCFYVLVLMFILPNLVKNAFSPIFTITLIGAMSISQFGQYFLGVTYQILLNADQKSYVQLIVNALTLVINTMLSIMIMSLGGSIQVVKLTTSLVYLFRPLSMYIYVKKKYEIDYSVIATGAVIPQKWSGIIQHVSYMIYENTDVVVLTIFSSLSNVSIYSVYILVVNSVKTLINAATTGVQAFFGNIIANKEEKMLSANYDMYEWFIHTISTLLFSITNILIVPFVMLYTRGIHDADYSMPSFAFCITMAYLVNTIRNAVYVMIRAAGHYKQTQIASMIEACINLGISILLVTQYGLVGVAIGTFIATLFFLIYETLYLSRKIVHRSIFKLIKQAGVDVLEIILYLSLTQWISVSNVSYGYWFLSAMKIGIVSFLICVGIQMLFFRQNVKHVLFFLKDKR